MNDRQSGQTTQQMKNAPPGAIYVWVNSHIYYPVQLARSLGRADLKIVSSSWLEDKSKIVGSKDPVIIDHACDITIGDRIYALDSLQANRRLVKL